MGDKLTIHWLETGDTRGLYQKYCFMESAARGEIAFHVWPKRSFVRFGFDPGDVSFFKEGFSFFRAEINGRGVLAIIDNKDSFFNISPLISKADLYFLGAYSPEIIEGKSFPEQYWWQTKKDIAPYMDHFRRMVVLYGDMFCKIVKSIPMPMIMHPPLRSNSPAGFSFRRATTVAAALLCDRIARKRQRPFFLWLEKKMFAIRYRELTALRHLPLKYDVVAADTLWAWPEHRAKLHWQIASLPSKRRTLARLNVPLGGASWSTQISPSMLSFAK